MQAPYFEVVASFVEDGEAVTDKFTVDAETESEASDMVAAHLSDCQNVVIVSAIQQPRTRNAPTPSTT